MPQSRRPTKESERARLKKVIAEWNASRLDMFAMSDPSEDLEFHGVMRFFFQDASHRVSTKCVRVASSATTQQVISALIERFRPDMKMLTATVFSLFEVFPNGDERRLKPNEKPLLIQLNWHKEDLEGRFLLKRDVSEGISGILNSPGVRDVNVEKSGSLKLKRRWSRKDKERRENKEGGKISRPPIMSVDDTTVVLSTGTQSSAAEALYDELPESTLTRSISNPEAVMRRRRQQKFEKKLEICKKDGENSGDLMRVYAETLRPEIPYKTLLVAQRDTADVVVREAVDKFGLGKQNARQYCLVLTSMSVTGLKRTWRSGPERVIQSDEQPLKIKREWASTKSEPSFHLRKRPFVPHAVGVVASYGEFGDELRHECETNEGSADKELPYLVKVTTEGHMTPDATKFRLQPNVTQIGSEKARSATGSPAVNLSEMLLPFPDIEPRHCKLANMSGFVTLTPLSPQAQTFINNERVTETTLLQNRCMIRFGGTHTFLYVDPRMTKRPTTAAPSRQLLSSAIIQSNGVLPQQKARTQSERAKRHLFSTDEDLARDEIVSDFGVPPSHFHSTFSNIEPIGATRNEKSVEKREVRSTVDVPLTVASTLPKASRNAVTRRTSSERILTSGIDARRLSGGRYGHVSSGGHGNTKKLAAAASHAATQFTQTTSHKISSNGFHPPPVVNKRKQQTMQSVVSTGSDSVFASVDDTSMELPAQLAFGDEHEDSILSAVVRRCNGAAAQFKLAPAFVLYLCVKYRASSVYHAAVNAAGGTARSVVKLVSKAVTLMSRKVQESTGSFGDLCFWLANSSEFLNFLRMDETLADPAVTVTLELEGVIKTAFYQLVEMMQQELCTCITSFLEVESQRGNSDDQTSDVVVTRLQNDVAVWIIPSWQARSDQGQPSLSSLISTLSTMMAFLRCCRVNTTLIIQLFSHAFHYINAWLFNKLVQEPRLGLCCCVWGERLSRRLERIRNWAKRQGLELAAESHMARVMQACRLLASSKSSPEDVTSIASTFVKLNSLQLRTILHLYHSAFNEAPMYPKLIASVASIAESTVDELTRSEGREVSLEEDTNLATRLVIPQEGYSCDTVTGVPAGITEFLDPLIKHGCCKLTVYSTSSIWASWKSGQARQTAVGSPTFTEGGKPPPIAVNSMQSSLESRPADYAVASRKRQTGDEQVDGPVKCHVAGELEVVEMTLLKGDGGLGVSIIGGKNCGDVNWGIYVKSIVRGGKADKDGRLQAGDQLLQVDDCSLLDVTQEEAAQIMKKTGPIVTLKIAKQAALHHGIAIADPAFTSKPQGDQQLTDGHLVSPVKYRKQRRSDEPSPSADLHPSRWDNRRSMGEISPNKPQLVKWVYEQQQQRAQQNAEKLRARMRNDAAAEARIDEMIQEKDREHKARMDLLRKENEAKQLGRQESDRGRIDNKVGSDGQSLQRGDHFASLHRRHSEPLTEPATSPMATGASKHTPVSSVPKVKEQSEDKDHERLRKVELEWRKAFAAQSTQGVQDRERQRLERERLERHRSEEELRRRIVADSQYLERQKREKAFLENLAEEGTRDGRGQALEHPDGLGSGLVPVAGNGNISMVQKHNMYYVDENLTNMEVPPEQRTRRPAGIDTQLSNGQNPEILGQSVAMASLRSGVRGESDEKRQELLANLEQQEDNELAKQEQLVLQMQQEKAQRRELERQAVLNQLKEEEEMALEQERKLQELRRQREIRLKQIQDLESHEEEEHQQWLAEQRRRKLLLEQQRQAQESELQRLQDENSKLEALHKRRAAGSVHSLKSLSPEPNKVSDTSKGSSPRRGNSHEHQSQPDISTQSRPPPPLKHKGSFSQLHQDLLPAASERSRMALAQYSFGSSHNDGLSESGSDLQLTRAQRPDDLMDSLDRREFSSGSHSSQHSSQSASPSQTPRTHHTDIERGHHLNIEKSYRQQPPGEDRSSRQSRTAMNAAKRIEFFNPHAHSSRPRNINRQSDSFRDFNHRCHQSPTQSSTTYATSSEHIPERPIRQETSSSRQTHANGSASVQNIKRVPTHSTSHPTLFQDSPYQPQQADV